MGDRPVLLSFVSASVLLYPVSGPLLFGPPQPSPWRPPGGGPPPRPPGGGGGGRCSAWGCGESRCCERGCARVSRRPALSSFGCIPRSGWLDPAVLWFFICLPLGLYHLPLLPPVYRVPVCPRPPSCLLFSGFLFVLACSPTCGKFPVWGSNLCHRRDLSHSRDRCRFPNLLSFQGTLGITI